MAETLKIPNQVIDSDWKDDIGDFETYGTEKQEMEYVPPDEVSEASIEKIKAMNLERGRSVLDIFKHDKLAA